MQFDVHNLLSANADLDCWITWIKGIVDRFMGVPTQQYPYTVSQSIHSLCDIGYSCHVQGQTSKLLHILCQGIHFQVDIPNRTAHQRSQRQPCI